MGHVPQELVDKFVDELEGDHKSLRTCSLVSRCWVGRSRRHLFQTISFPAAGSFARYCRLFPPSHAVHSYVRGLAITQWNQDPWVDENALHCGLEHLKAFHALESLILVGVVDRFAWSYNIINALADCLRVAAPSIKTMRLAHWRVSPTVLIEFICRFPSLDSLIIEDMDYFAGLPGWRPPCNPPPFAGRFEFSNNNGHGPAEKFLRHLSRLPLGFKEISIDVAFHGTPDFVLTILERCSPTLTRLRLRCTYTPGTAMVPPSPTVDQMFNSRRNF